MARDFELAERIRAVVGGGLIPLTAEEESRLTFIAEQIQWGEASEETLQSARDFLKKYDDFKTLIGSFWALMSPGGDVPTKAVPKNSILRLLAELQRLRDLVRYKRSELHDEGLISDLEYAALASDEGSPARLEGYDRITRQLKEQEAVAIEALTRRGVSPDLFEGVWALNPIRVLASCTPATGQEALDLLCMATYCEQLRQALAFASSAIKSGERWSDSCEQLITPLLDKKWPGAD